MRADLTKVLCEHERVRSWDKFHNYRHDKDFDIAVNDDDYDDEDDEPFTGVGSGHRESMKKRYVHGGWPKEFGEHLTPLYGIVRKNVGRKWDKVYSELNEAFDRRSATGDHIFQHLFDRLARPEETFIGEDGKVWLRGRYGSGASRIKDSYYEFYVDPRDGILKKNHLHKTYRQVQRQRAAERQKEQLNIKRVVDKLTELHNINGVWFEIKYVEHKGTTRNVVTTYEYGGKAKPLTLTRTITEYPFTYDVLQQSTVQARRVAVSKRTMSHKDLKKHGLI